VAPGRLKPGPSPADDGLESPGRGATGAGGGPMKDNLAIKLVILGGLSFFFAAVLIAIYGVVSERRGYRDRVVNEVAESTARAQTLTGPLLVTSFRERFVTRQGKDRAERIEVGQVVLLPESLTVRTSVQVEERYRGIYKAHVYRSTHVFSGVFRVPARLGIDPTRDIVLVEPAELQLGVTDSRGLRKPPRMTCRGTPVEIVAGTDLAWLEQGISGAIGPAFWPEERRLPFEVEMEIIGTDRISFVPVGATMHAEIESAWPHPSFDGGFLPDERNIGPRGFRASWQLTRFATGVEAGIQRGQVAQQWLAGRDFGVRFVQPADVYQQSARSVKYGMLFVLLTFAAFSLFEVLKRLAVHPVQYGLAGAAVALFFLLLVSLSEHVPFALAYLVASAACVGLITFYVAHVMHGLRRGLGFGALLTLLYGLLYVLLQSEDYALLLGSLLLFALLAVVMVMTRRVDWYKLGEGSPS
jgi:inner membrane protein